MASLPSPRDPLLDHRIQAVLHQRGKELLGMALVGLGLILALILGSYSPADPGWMAATDAPVHNALGRLGAAVAAPLVIITGQAGWGLVIALAVWGLRLIVHQGEGAILARSIFVPIAVALSTVWLATLVPGAGWQQDFGLGGMFGDTVLGALLTALPISSTLGLNLLTLATFGIAVAMWFYVLGCSLREVLAGAAFLMAGLILTYAALASLTGRALRGTGRGMAQGLGGALLQAQDAMAARAAARAQAQARARAQAPLPAAAWAGLPPEPPLSAPSEAPRTRRPAYPPTPPVPALTPEPDRAAARVINIIRRPAEPLPEPELWEPPLTAAALRAEPPRPDRIKDRIAELLRSRPAKAPALRFDPAAAPAARVEPVLTAPAPTAPAAPFGFSHTFGWTAPVAPVLAAPVPFAPVEPPAPPRAEARPLRPRPPEPALIEDDADADEDAALDAHVPPAPRSGWGFGRRVIQPAPRKSPAPSTRARAEAQPALPFEAAPEAYEPPPLSLLADPSRRARKALSEEALDEDARMLETVLEDYGVRGEIVAVRPGPVVTLYELEPAPGLKASRVIGLADDIARSMSAVAARVCTVPGRSVIGIELPLPADHRETVLLREILGSRDFGDSNLRLPLALGKDIGGDPVVANLAKMPHLLIAGTTGSGKSVAINTMILSLLYKLTPAECRLIMIDPKMLELSVYDGIPHLLSPVVTDPKKAVVALKWVVGEMEERYRRMSKMGVRSIEGYNSRVREAQAKGEMFKRTIQTGFDDETGDPVFETEEFLPEVLPFIVVVVDEMADLMMVAGKEIEACIQRLAQMARASGIHLIMATQRPSVDVITGTIKANFPTRISFQVTSKIDSRTILGEQGAEQLLGQGDMLYLAGGSKITRVHGPFVSDREVEEVVRHLKSFGPPQYVTSVLDAPEADMDSDGAALAGLGEGAGDDALYDQAVAIVAKDRKCSTSYIQRKLGIGYNKAARLVEQMETEGVVSRANAVGKRDILVPEA